MPATNSDDVLSTMSNDEILSGLGGNDILSTVFNNTTLAGDDGDDSLKAKLAFTNTAIGPLAATLRGGAGNDKIQADVDLFLGGEFLYAAGGGALIIDGESGNDEIDVRFFLREFGFGVDAKTLTNGGDGDDIINVSLEALDGSAHNESYGGSGNDRITLWAQGRHPGGSMDTTNIIDGGDGNDVLEAVGGGGQFRATTNHFLTGGLGNDELTSTAYGAVNGGGMVALHELSGGEGNDFLKAISATANDSGGASDVVSNLTGGAGNDRIFAESALIGYFSGGVQKVRQSLDGDVGDDDLSAKITLGDEGSRQYDLLNSLKGGFGKDNLESLILFDHQYGGFIAEGSIVNILDGGDNNDKIKTVIRVDSPYFEFSGSLGFDFDFSNKTYGGSGNDFLEAIIEIDVYDIYGNSGDTFTVGSNLVDGGKGNDTLVGRVNVQNVEPTIGYAGFSALYGGAGNDQLTVFGGHGNILDGGAGRDLLVGGSGVDNLYGGAGVDTLYGGGGADEIFGGGSNDVLFGGEGADRFHFAKSGGSDVIGDFNVLFDRIAIDDGLAFLSYTVTDYNLDGEADLVLQFTKKTQAILLGVDTFDIGIFG